MAKTIPSYLLPVRNHIEIAQSFPFNLCSEDINVCRVQSTDQIARHLERYSAKSATTHGHVSTPYEWAKMMKAFNSFVPSQPANIGCVPSTRHRHRTLGMPSRLPKNTDTDHRQCSELYPAHFSKFVCACALFSSANTQQTRNNDRGTPVLRNDRAARCDHAGYRHRPGARITAARRPPGTVQKLPTRTMFSLFPRYVPGIADRAVFRCRTYRLPPRYSAQEAPTAVAPGPAPIQPFPRRSRSRPPRVGRGAELISQPRGRHRCLADN